LAVERFDCSCGNNLAQRASSRIVVSSPNFRQHSLAIPI
jgi:hypothetical protein